MAEATTPTKKSNKKKWILIIGGLVAIIAIAAAAAFVFLHNRQLAGQVETADEPDAETAQPQQQQAAQSGSKASEHTFAPLDPFTVNLTEGDHDRFAQVGVVFEVSNSKTADALKEVQPVVRSEILLLISSKSAQEMLSLKGKQDLSVEFVAIARKHIAPEFKRNVFAAHFSTFVIQ